MEDNNSQKNGVPEKQTSWKEHGFGCNAYDIGEDINRVPSRKRRRQKRAKVRKDFAQGTSCHGLAQLYASENRLLTIFWILLLLTVFGLLIWQVSLRIQAYFRLDTRLQISELFVNELTLPAITICNANRYFLNLTANSKEERQALNTLSFVYDNGFLPSNTSAEAAIQYFENQTKTEGVSFTEYLVSRSWPFDDDTLQICYAGAFDACSEANFTSSFSTNLGQCWTLFSNITQQKRGTIHGFHILLNAYQTDYTEDPTYGKASAGILFQVHPEHEPPQVMEVGQSVGVGQWGTVAMHKQQNTNMRKPWGNCVPGNENLERYSTYTVAACMKECFDERVIEICKCRDPSVTRFPEARECSPGEVIKCAAPQRSLLEAIINPADCDCTQACSETKYRTSISYSTFPSQIAAREIGGDELTLGDFRENFVGMTFYYDSLSTTTIVESEAISASALISDVGGQLGFWIGISVVTLCEFIQFFVKMILTIDWKGFRRQDQS